MILPGLLSKLGFWTRGLSEYFPFNERKKPLHSHTDEAVLLKAIIREKRVPIGALASRTKLQNENFDFKKFFYAGYKVGLLRFHKYCDDKRAEVDVNPSEIDSPNGVWVSYCAPPYNPR